MKRSLVPSVSILIALTRTDPEPPSEASPAELPASLAGQRIAWTVCDPGIESWHVEALADCHAPRAGGMAVAASVPRAFFPGESIGSPFGRESRC